MLQDCAKSKMPVGGVVAVAMPFRIFRRNVSIFEGSEGYVQKRIVISTWFLDIFKTLLMLLLDQYINKASSTTNTTLFF